MAMQSMVDYQPIHAAHSIANLVQLQASLAHAAQTTRQAEVALDAARALEAEISHTYHDAVVGARAHVVAQYGPDSAAVEQVGLTRKSNRKRPVRHKAAA
jgi:hypothetical protein